MSTEAFAPIRYATGCGPVNLTQVLLNKYNFLKRKCNNNYILLFYNINNNMPTHVISADHDFFLTVPFNKFVSF